MPAASPKPIGSRRHPSAVWPTAKSATRCTTRGASVTCPTLVMAGDNDPITPIAFSETIVASLPPGLAQFERFADCGHGIVRDAPDRHFETLRRFLLS